MKAVFSHSVTESSTIETFYFVPERSLTYTAGQFVELHIPHNNPDSRGQNRWFTLSSSPTEEKISITTRFHAEHSSSYKFALRALQAGDTVRISEPMGDFVLPKLVQTPLVFVAIGIGVTPFLSIFRYLHATGEQRNIKLIYGVATEEDIIAQDIFDVARVHATVVVKDPADAWGGERGRITAQMVLGIEQPSTDTLVYVSGPEPFVETLGDDLKKAGLPKNRLVRDLFPNYPEL